jgi:hypothetical protein
VAAETKIWTKEELVRQREFLTGAIRFADRNDKEHPLLDSNLQMVEEKLEDMERGVVDGDRVRKGKKGAVRGANRKA